MKNGKIKQLRDQLSKLDDGCFHTEMEQHSWEIKIAEAKLNSERVNLEYMKCDLRRMMILNQIRKLEMEEVKDKPEKDVAVRRKYNHG